MTGASWRPPPAPAGWASAAPAGRWRGALGGAGRVLGGRRSSGWGGGGGRSRSRIAGSGASGRAGLRPAAIARWGPQPDLARHQRFRRLVANGVKCTSNYSELSTYHEYGNIFSISCTVCLRIIAISARRQYRSTRSGLSGTGGGRGWVTPGRVSSGEA